MKDEVKKDEIRIPVLLMVEAVGILLDCKARRILGLTECQKKNLSKQRYGPGTEDARGQSEEQSQSEKV